jgi:hypothetical protein
MDTETLIKFEMVKKNMVDKSPLPPIEHAPEIPDTVYCTIGIRHELLVPEKVTRLLDIEPTSTGTKGESSVFGSIKQIGGWYLSTKNRVISDSPDDHVSWLINQFDGKTPAVRLLQSQGCTFIVRCHLSTKKNACLVPLSSATILGLGHLRAALDLGLCFERVR